MLGNQVGIAYEEADGKYLHVLHRHGDRVAVEETAHGLRDPAFPGEQQLVQCAG